MALGFGFMEWFIYDIESAKLEFETPEGLSPQRLRSHLAHALLLRLANKHGLPPDCAISIAEGGKPFFESYPDFHFNISHTRQYIAIALHTAPVGVDIESPRPYKAEISERFFHPKEASYLRELEKEKQSEGFTRIWTAKEAVVKQSGDGIANNFKSFAAIPSHECPKGFFETAFHCAECPKEFTEMGIHFDQKPAYAPKCQSAYLKEYNLYLALCY